MCMGVHDMGSFGIVSGVVVSTLALAISLVSGGGFGAGAPMVAGSGPATPPAARATADAAPSSAALEAAATRIATAPPASEDAGFGADESGSMAGAEFAVDGTAAGWESATKHTAPNELSPAYLSTDPETIARVQALAAAGQSCPSLGSFTTSGAPSARSAQGVAGTTTADLESFAAQYNKIRYENCLPPVQRFIYDSCMEQRLFWMAESPSPDPLDAWGHIGSVRIDGVPSVGCDGNLAGGSGNTGATVATKWWQSLSHRASLYRPGTSTSGVCIALAVTHGGIDEPSTFTRAAARWVSC